MFILEEKNSPRLDKTYISSLPKIAFEGEINIVNTNEELENCVAELIKEKMIGFDTESRPAFQRGQYFPISLLQFSTLKKAYIVQRKYIDMEILRPIFESESLKKVGIALHEDRRKMNKDLGVDFILDGFVDLSYIARKKGIIQIGARSLSARYLEATISKSAQTSNWANKELTEKQLTYAATDSWVCLKIYPHLVKDDTDYHQILADQAREAEEEENSN